MPHIKPKKTLIYNEETLCYDKTDDNALLIIMGVNGQVEYFVTTNDANKASTKAALQYLKDKCDRLQCPCISPWMVIAVHQER